MGMWSFCSLWGEVMAMAFCQSLRLARRTSHVTHHASHVTRHTSHITHHTSRITHHTPKVFDARVGRWRSGPPLPGKRALPPPLPLPPPSRTHLLPLSSTTPSSDTRRHHPSSTLITLSSFIFTHHQAPCSLPSPSAAISSSRAAAKVQQTQRWVACDV